jgi:hypothetical protein
LFLSSDTEYLSFPISSELFYKDIKNILHRQHPTQFILFLILGISTLTH